MPVVSLKITLSAAVAMGSMAASLWAAAALVNQNSSQASYAGLATVHENRAERALTATPLTASDLDKAEAESRKALELSPANPWTALRLAYVEYARTGRLGANGLAALQQSYDVSPYGPQVSRWRITFAFNHWSELTPSLKQQAASEVRVTHPLHPGMVQAAVLKVENRSGRLAARAVMASMDAEPR